MSKILLFSDIHIAAHKHSLDRLYDCLGALEWVFQTASQKQISHIVFAGDLFQDRQKIDVLTYDKTFQILRKYCIGNTKLYLLLGNHDLWYHDKWDISSVHPLEAILGVTVIDKPSTIEVNGHLIDFLPYTHHPIEHLNSLKKSKTLVAHLAVHGSQLNTLYNTKADVIIEHDGEMTKVDASLFTHWDQVWLGHYHGNQKISSNAEYIGSTLQLSFGEAFQHKYLIINDLETGSIEYVKNTFSPQHFIIPEKDIEKYDIKNNFIRIEVDDMGKAGIIDIKKSVAGQKPGSLEILSSNKIENEHIVKDAQKILLKDDEMFEEYVAQVDVGDLDKGLLIKTVSKIKEYNEGTKV